MDIKNTGRLIAALRKEQHMTQKELAELLYLSDRTISKWERGAGTPLEPLEAKPEDDTHAISVETIDGEYYVSVQHVMTKEHHIAFMAYLTGDKLYLNRLYPEGDAASRFLRIGMGTLYVYCTDDGLYRKYIRRERKA